MAFLSVLLESIDEMYVKLLYEKISIVFPPNFTICPFAHLGLPGFVKPLQDCQFFFALENTHSH